MEVFVYGKWIELEDDENMSEISSRYWRVNVINGTINSGHGVMILRADFWRQVDLKHMVKCVNEHENLVAENCKLKGIITSLVNLKRHKEQNGKTLYYEEYKERIWDDAKRIVDEEVGEE